MSKLTLRPYQSQIKDSILQDLQSPNTRSIMAMCTGAGKTATAHVILKEYLAKHPDHRVLVLAHGQKIIRDNFAKYDVLPMYVMHSSTEGGRPTTARNSQVVVTLPQTADKKDLGKFQLAIIDEAHNFYGKGQMARITADIPRHVLLTASHGKFCPKKWNKYNFSVLEAFSEKVVAKTAIELVNCGWDFSEEDYTKQDELRQSTKVDVSQAMDKLAEKLKALSIMSPTWSQALKGLPSLGKVRKTLIACRSINMAEEVYEYFAERYPDKVVISHSKGDENQEQLRQFTDNPDKRIAVVVDRGRIGYDLPELEVVVDMTCTRNVETVRQLMGRGMRNHKGLKKIYLKVMPEHMEYYTVAMMACVVALMDPTNDRNFRGKWKEVPLIVKTPSNPKPRKPGEKKETNKKPRVPEYVQDFEDYHVLFTRMNHKGGEPLTSHAFTTLGRVLAGMRGVKEARYWNYERCKQAAEECGATGLLDWEKKYDSSYQAAYRNNWQSQIAEELGWKIQSKVQTGHWTYELCKQAAEDCGATGLTDWQKKHEASYRAAYNNNWQRQIAEELRWEVQDQVQRGHWTYETCKQTAEDCGATRLSDWKKKHNSSYLAAFKNNWHRQIAQELGWKIRGESQ